jgi:transcriptional regulator
MYRPPAFAVDDIVELHAFIHKLPFATLAANIGGAVHFAYAPVLLAPDAEKGIVRFHLALQNPLAALADGARVRFSWLGPHAYISPDWYGDTARVPTWNYMAVEGEGAVRRLDGAGLHQLLIELSHAEETPLLPKKRWTLDKVPEQRIAALETAIVGFSVPLETLEGKFKLSQNIAAAEFEGAVAGLEARGDAASVAVAKEMRRAKR